MSQGFILRVAGQQAVRVGLWPMGAHLFGRMAVVATSDGHQVLPAGDLLFCRHFLGSLLPLLPFLGRRRATGKGHKGYGRGEKAFHDFHRRMFLLLSLTL